MYSPSARLTELISSYLGDFFQSVEKDHLQVSGIHWPEAKERQINTLRVAARTNGVCGMSFAYPQFCD